VNLYDPTGLKAEFPPVYEGGGGVIWGVGFDSYYNGERWQTFLGPVAFYGPVVGFAPPSGGSGAPAPLNLTATSPLMQTRTFVRANRRLRRSQGHRCSI
jgi:hypothetical protein